MKNSKNLLTAEQIKSIESTIADVETYTSAELVPVIASNSGRYHSAQGLFAFLLCLIVLTCVWLLFQGVSPNENGWNADANLTLNLPIILLIVSASFLIGILLSNRFPQLCLFLVSDQEMQEQVERSARESFQRFRTRNTTSSTGILIYISLYEHMVHVIGDDSINKKLSSSDWLSLCTVILKGFKEGKPSKGLTKGILLCQDMLAKHFPADVDNTNELSNSLNFI